MDQRTLKELLSGQRLGFGPAMLRCALWLASKPYCTTMRLRRWGYRRGLFSSHAATVPVISVGNLTAGGTGKTPMVAWIIGQLQSAARRPAVVMRGYKSHEGRSDEAILLEQLTGAAVVVNPDRVAGAEAAVSAGADVIVLDDGFQHRRLRRRLDIVLIDATEPWGLGHCLPRGLLREPPSALKDAGAIVITRSDAVSDQQLQALRARVKELAPQAIIAEAIHKPAAVIDASGARQDVSTLSGRKLFAFCGIGNPQSFVDSLKGMGAEMGGSKVLDDHVHYTPQLLRELGELAQASGCTEMITTQKDFVKIDVKNLPLPLMQLVVEMDVGKGREELLQFMFKV